MQKKFAPGVGNIKQIPAVATEAPSKQRQFGRLFSGPRCWPVNQHSTRYLAFIRKEAFVPVPADLAVLKRYTLFSIQHQRFGVIGGEFCIADVNIRAGIQNWRAVPA